MANSKSELLDIRATLRLCGEITCDHVHHLGMFWEEGAQPNREMAIYSQEASSSAFSPGFEFYRRSTDHFFS